MWLQRERGGLARGAGLVDVGMYLPCPLLGRFGNSAQRPFRGRLWLACSAVHPWCFTASRPSLVMAACGSPTFPWHS